MSGFLLLMMELYVIEKSEVFSNGVGKDQIGLFRISPLISETFSSEHFGLFIKCCAIAIVNEALSSKKKKKQRRKVYGVEKIILFRWCYLCYNSLRCHQVLSFVDMKMQALRTHDIHK